MVRLMFDRNSNVFHLIRDRNLNGVGRRDGRRDVAGRVTIGNSWFFTVLVGGLYYAGTRL